MKNLLMLCLMCRAFVVCAQMGCPHYNDLIREGETALHQQNFKKAIEAFSNAMIHCPAKADEARTKIVKAFDAINALKKQAEKDRTAAKKAQQAAETAKKEAQQRAEEAEAAKKATEIALLQADSARKKVQAVLDKIYFYEGKFGLAYDNRRYAEIF